MGSSAPIGECADGLEFDDLLGFLVLRLKDSLFIAYQFLRSPSVLFRVIQKIGMERRILQFDLLISDPHSL